MKKFFQSTLFLLTILSFATESFSQKKMKEGVVKFEINTENMPESPEMAMMGGTSLNFYFTEDNQKMDMNMMGGMMRIQTIVPTKNPKDGTMLMDMMGQKIQVIGMSEDDLSQSNNFMNMDNIEEVKYDESDKKTIAGHDCYFASLKTKTGQTMKYYITERIQPPAGIKAKDATVLKGYPLEMIIEAGQGMELTFTAKEVSDELPDDTFKIGQGYKQMTMEEFEKQMGGMGMGGLGN